MQGRFFYLLRQCASAYTSSCERHYARLMISSTTTPSVKFTHDFMGLFHVPKC